MSLPAFTLRALGPFGEGLLNKGISNYAAAADFIRALPYRRTSDKNRLLSVLEENCGTCSSKHAFLKQLAVEQEQTSIELLIGIYKMSNTNTPGIGSHLSDHGLPYIPEAHCYLRYQGQRYDYTNPQSDIRQLETDILEEISINADQIGSFKVNYHQAYISKWLLQEQLPFTLGQVWQIREQCIASLSGQ